MRLDIGTHSTPRKSITTGEWCTGRLIDEPETVQLANAEGLVGDLLPTMGPEGADPREKPCRVLK